MIPTTTVNGEAGYVFCGTIPDAYCFVPVSCVSIAANGQLTVDKVRYFTSGWSVRNMRATDLEPGGSHLFPEAGQPVSDLASPEVEQFLTRVTHRTRHPFAATAAG